MLLPCKENLGSGPFRVATRRYALSFISRLIKSNSANAFQAGCPNILSSVLFSSPWLGGNQSLLVQETQPAKDIDLTCFKTFRSLPRVSRLRERLRLITPHWPSYPNAVGIILDDFNICEPEGRFNVWNQHSLMVTWEKLLCVIHFSQTFLR